MSAPVLTELQEDALAELLNIGMGLASASLSEIVREEVQLSVPSVEFLLKKELINYITKTNDEKLTCVKQSFSGTFWGNALLLFPETKSLSLVRAMTGDTLPMEDLTDMEQDVLSEIGNIVLNSCLGSLANVLGDQIQSQVPVCLVGTGEEVLTSDTENSKKIEHVMLIRLDFSVPQIDVGGYVVFLLDVDSIARLQEEIDNFLSPNFSQKSA